MDWKHETGSHFNNHAQNNLLPVYPWLLKDLITAINEPLLGKNILEIGCGPGFMLPLFVAENAQQVCAIDLSFAMLGLADSSGRAQQVNLIQGEAGALPFVAGSFDVVYSRGSIFFWSDLDAAFAAIARVLKPGGMALLGGGYGLSTPQEVIDRIRIDKPDHKKDIPRLDLAILVESALKHGGIAEILQAKKRGFWLKWQPATRS